MAEPGYAIEKQAVLTRLGRVEGQIRGLQRLVDEEQYCIDISLRSQRPPRLSKASRCCWISTSSAVCGTSLILPRPSRSSPRPPQPSDDSSARDRSPNQGAHMTTTDSSRNLQLANSPTDGGDCGCGGCGCGSGTDAVNSAETVTEVPTTAAPKEQSMTTNTYAVTGMTCGHCAGAVSSELKALDGVTDVLVDVVAGGTSSVTVTSDRPLDPDQVAAALDEAGDYQLA